MEKRPLSLTIIGAIIAILALLGLYGVATMGSNPVMTKVIAQMHVPMLFEQMWGVTGAIVSLVCAYGIFKGLPWSRLLYVAWSAIGLVAGFYIAPVKAALVVNLVLLIVFSIFLFGARANEWFASSGLALKREAD